MSGVCHKTPPAKYRRLGATQASDYADPECFKYPIRMAKVEDTKAHIRNAAARFGADAHNYPLAKRKRVAARIEEAKAKYGIGSSRLAKDSSASPHVHGDDHMAAKNSKKASVRELANAKGVSPEAKALILGETVKKKPAKKAKAAKKATKKTAKKAAKKATAPKKAAAPKKAKPAKKKTAKKAASKKATAPKKSGGKKMSAKMKSERKAARDAKKAIADLKTATREAEKMATAPKKAPKKKTAKKAKASKKAKKSGSPAKKSAKKAKKASVKKAASAPKKAPKKSAKKKTAKKAAAKKAPKKKAAKKAKKKSVARSSSIVQDGRKVSKAAKRAMAGKVKKSETRRYENERTGSKFTLTQHFKRAGNPVGGWGNVALLTGGAIVGAVVADVVDRIVATRPGNAPYPWAASDAAQRIMLRADGYRIAAQAGVAIAFFLGSYAAQKKMPKFSYFLAGMAVGATVKLGLQVLNDRVMPMIFKVTNGNERNLGSRLYYLNQDPLQANEAATVAAENANPTANTSQQGTATTLPDSFLWPPSATASSTTTTTGGVATTTTTTQTQQRRMVAGAPEGANRPRVAGVGVGTPNLPQGRPRMQYAGTPSQRVAAAAAFLGEPVARPRSAAAPAAFLGEPVARPRSAAAAHAQAHPVGVAGCPSCSSRQGMENGFNADGSVNTDQGGMFDDMDNGWMNPGGVGPDGSTAASDAPTAPLSPIATMAEPVATPVMTSTVNGPGGTKRLARTQRTRRSVDAALLGSSHDLRAHNFRAHFGRA